MRRGRVLIYLVLIIILVIILAAGYFFLRGGEVSATPTASPTPEVRYIEIVTAGQYIYPGTPITEDMLSTMRLPEDAVVEGVYTSKTDVVGQYARYAISQGVPINTAMVSLTPGNVNLPGSPWSPFIQQGLTAISIPITRLSSAAYGIRDGDYVNVIVTMLLVDIDANYQSVTPNNTAGVTGGVYIEDTAPILTINVTPGGPQGRTESEGSLNEAVYVIPSELQRPRMVSQLIMQKVQVLHVGTFPLPGESTSDQLIAPSPSEMTPTPAGQPAEAAPAAVVRPDIVTLMVLPQDAVTLTYLIYSGAQITLALRNPNDVDNYPPTDAATLQYLLSQYNIPVPAKLPYSLEPRIDILLPPFMPNDVIVTP